ncbi:DUF3105 domain-containing protein [Pseudonocardia yunnanensis]|uniref:DUF3105 domain-containing protein n=1 Tax=Pseudonocardia yunnanensis TaxID=58107 RepID=A0ABW4F1L8_9PSEU
MVSGNKSKASRSSRTRTPVVSHKSTPWGLIAAVLVVVLFAGGVFGYAFLRNQQNQAKTEALAPFTPTAENQDPSKQIPGVVVQGYPGGQHVGRDTQVAYTHSPPFGGAHDAVWAACNGAVYPEAVRTENLVHSLEHGAVWIAYNPDQVTGDALETLRSKVDGEPYTLMSPYPGLDQPISVQSWGHQLKLSDAADPRIDQFIAALRLNQYTYPEPGASCNEVGVSGGFSQDSPPPFVPAPAPGTPGSQAETTPGAGVAPDGGS